MTSIADLTQTLQTLLTTTAEASATHTGCIQRHRKLSGATVVQTLALGWLHQPAATLNHLAQMAATLGVPITPQGLDRRLTEQTALCLKAVLDVAMTQVVASDPVAVALLRRFWAVMIQEGSIVLLPEVCQRRWPARGRAVAAPTHTSRLPRSNVRSIWTCSRGRYKVRCCKTGASMILTPRPRPWTSPLVPCA